MSHTPGCPLCDSDGGILVCRAGPLRVIRADETGFPAFYRVVWTDHVPEFSELGVPDRALCMEAVAAVEQALRAQLAPDKVNLASLGNQVPHLHWHVIARYGWDSHFPAPVWAGAQRQAPAERLAWLQAQLAILDSEIARRVTAVVAGAPAA